MKYYVIPEEDFNKITKICSVTPLEIKSNEIDSEKFEEMADKYNNKKTNEGDSFNPETIRKNSFLAALTLITNEK